MGGNALKHLDTRRLSASDTEWLGRMLMARLNTLCPNTEGHCAAIIPAYRSKPDFGDLDILVRSELFARHGADDLAKALGGLSVTGEPLPWTRNGPVLSLGFPLKDGGAFQVDLISAPAEHFGFALGYFAYNDLGNLIGRVAHRQGLKFGHDGLWLPLREGSHCHATLLVTADFESALEFLGFDYERWTQGFDTLEDIFHYVVESEGFAREPYPLEHRSHRARTRDAKRATYAAFLRWLDSHPEIPDRYNYPPREYDAKDWALPTLFAAFPALKWQYQAAQQRWERTRACQQRLNGDVVRWITGLQGKALGALMTRIRSGYPDKDAFQSAVLAMSNADLEALILRHADKSEAGNA